MAQMQAMDKITGRVSIIEVPVNGEVKFGTFSVVVRSCKTNAEGEVPENYAFVDVSDKSFDKEEFNIFKGWMLSSSPAVNAVEHPIYDVWLIKCYNDEKPIDGLLSQEQLDLRDNLPRLQEVKQMRKDQENNTFDEETQKTTIVFKDTMYKQQLTEATKTSEKMLVSDDGKPQNLLNIDENFNEEEVVVMPAEELSEAMQNEAQNLNKNEEFLIDDELSAAIEAELKQHQN
ncbi:MAG: DUF2155 domain-containing protein [Alphaproteobacteria bacterium]|nr:DUF2155 domain-containing protein [Alphaproteobacteria bacterium]